jgi:hypothetical protein
MIEGFLLGVISTTSIVAAAFFLKFWRKTHDPLFAAFAAAFFIEGCNRISFLLVTTPEGHNPINYFVRLVSFLLILGAIAYKNWRR